MGDLDLYYAACDEANVTCKHVVIVRDPYEVIRSTTSNRNFTSKHNAIKLYTTMLDVMYAQVSNHRKNSRLVTLFDYNDDDMKTNGSIRLGKLLGFNNSTEFERYYNSKRSPPTPMTDEEKKQLVPENLRPYMDVMI